MKIKYSTNKSSWKQDESNLMYSCKQYISKESVIMLNSMKNNS